MLQNFTLSSAEKKNNQVHIMLGEKFKQMLDLNNNLGLLSLVFNIRVPPTMIIRTVQKEPPVR
ncbi:hypothetical protein DsansV1_C44g0240411 [Dioscorea sansibarensis]